jgi:hypothetical protein
MLEPIDRLSAYSVGGCCGYCWANDYELVRMPVGPPPTPEATELGVGGELWLLQCRHCGRAATDCTSRGDAAYHLQEQGEPVEAARTAYSALFQPDAEGFRAAADYARAAAEGLGKAGSGQEALVYAREAVNLDVICNIRLPWDMFGNQDRSFFAGGSQKYRSLVKQLAGTGGALPGLYPEGVWSPALSTHSLFRWQALAVIDEGRMVAHEGRSEWDIAQGRPLHFGLDDSARDCYRAALVCRYVQNVDLALRLAQWCVHYDELYWANLPSSIYSDPGPDLNQFLGMLRDKSTRRHRLLESLRKSA